MIDANSKEWREVAAFIERKREFTRGTLESLDCSESVANQCRGALLVLKDLEELANPVTTSPPGENVDFI